MLPSGSDLTEGLSKETLLFGLRVWVVIGLAIGLFIVIILLSLAMWIALRKRRTPVNPKMDMSEISFIEKEIKGMRQNSYVSSGALDGAALTVYDKTIICELDACVDSFPLEKRRISQCGHGNGANNDSATNLSHPMKDISPLAGLPGFSFNGWGHWFTLRDLEIATSYFSKENVIGEGGYGIVYRGLLTNGTPVAVKKLLNNVGQAEKEFQVEVEAIGHVHHINLVRLLGYCVEGTQRLLVYEYVNNGNLEQWLHESLWQGSLTWEARMKILRGTANALAYLHEGIEPKVVHRDIKSSNILIDDDFNGKVSDFGLAKLLGAGKSHITTRVMGTFGYVAPEYARTGLLNEKSDVYSFGVVLLEAISGRSPVDYSRLAHEVNLVDWLKVMIVSKRSQEVVDPNILERPSTRALKRALLTALRCIDPDPEKRPGMGQVVRLLLGSSSSSSSYSASEDPTVPGQRQRASREMPPGSGMQAEAFV